MFLVDNWRDMRSSHVVLAGAGSYSRAGLAVARSLGRHGLKVVAVARTTDNMVAKSRFVDSCLVGPDPIATREEYAEYIAMIAGQFDAALVIPISDAAVSALNDNRHYFLGTAPLALPHSDSVTRVLDKRENLVMARMLGVPCPREYKLRSRFQARELIATLGFPIVLKNPTPDSADSRNPLPFRVSMARDASELEELLDIVEESDTQPICQQFVRGDGICVCTFAIEGEVVASHSYVSRRRSTHEGIAREIIELDSTLAEYSRLMIEALQWTGVAHMQFLVNPKTGECGYMETNGRFWASTQGSINAGWDFPQWVYQYYVDGVRPIFHPIELGSRTVYRKADMHHLLRYLVRGQSTPSGYSGRLSAVWQTLRDFRPGIHSDVWMWSDPKPGIYDFLQTFSWSNFRKVLGYSQE